MTECEEVASIMNPPILLTQDQYVAFVRKQMPDESYVVVSNVAYALWRKYG